MVSTVKVHVILRRIIENDNYSVRTSVQSRYVTTSIKLLSGKK